MSRTGVWIRRKWDRRREGRRRLDEASGQEGDIPICNHQVIVEFCRFGAIALHSTCGGHSALVFATVLVCAQSTVILPPSESAGMDRALL